MAGHSKWKQIKHKKAATDAKRAQSWTKVIREITVAAKAGGGDPAGNPRLRTAIDAAKAVNMPNDNIDRAVKKGTGELEGASYEEVSYEGYGPGGTAIFIEASTDNANRTVAEVRHALSRNGGNMGATGSVAWMFDRLDSLKAAGFTIASSEIAMVPKNLVKVEGGDAQKVLKLIDTLEELDDVSKVFTNLDIDAVDLAEAEA